MSTTLISSHADAPYIVIWEMTRACALACHHCRAEAIPHRSPGELTTTEAFALVDAVVDCGKPLFVLTGGDPFMRDDLYKILEYAVSRGLRTAVSPSATGRLTSAALQGLTRAGCHRISLSIDAAAAESHDAFRGVRGSFERTIAAVHAARACGLEVQINTTISRYNYTQIEGLVKLMSTLDIALWSVFFLVPVGRAKVDDVLNAGETEAAFAELRRASDSLPFSVKTTEAPHYRRYLLQHPLAKAKAPAHVAAIGDGKGFAFISHRGDIFPSGFLPISVGNVRIERLIDVYRDNPIMQRLRDPDTFDGKCGVCEFRRVCGGSRSRAYAMTGDPFSSDPTCAYVPSGSSERITA